MQLEGTAALVTGSGTGVGRATALALAARRCDVAVHYQQSQREAEVVVAEIQAAGGRAVALQADVADDKQCRRLVEQTVQAFGRLEILVNSAGTTRFIPHGALERITDDDWDRILGVNLRGPFQCIRAARPHLEAAGSAEVVNVASIAGISATGSSIPYAASKAALNESHGFTRPGAAPGIRVNAVAPGFITGRWLEQGLGEQYEAVKQRVEQRTPLGRVCRPEDVADAILGLLAGSDLVTGQTLVVDGGMLIADSLAPPTQRRAPIRKPGPRLRNL